MTRVGYAGGFEGEGEGVGFVGLRNGASAGFEGEGACVGSRDGASGRGARRDVGGSGIVEAVIKSVDGV